MTADRTPPLLPIVTGVGEYCAPRDAAPRWMLVFDDADRGRAVYDNEQDARKYFAAAEQRGYNCYLFVTERRASAPRGDAQEAERQFGYLLNAFEQASQHDKPATVGYADKRAAVLEFVRAQAREIAALRHDIERAVATNAEVATENAAKAREIDGLYTRVERMREQRDTAITNADDRLRELLSELAAQDRRLRAAEGIMSDAAISIEVCKGNLGEHTEGRQVLESTARKLRAAMAEGQEKS